MGSRPSRRTRRESPLAAPPWPVNESLRSWGVNRTAAPRPGPPADPADHDGWVYPLAVCSPAAADRGRPHPVAGPPIVAGGRRAELINTHWLWRSVVDRGVLASSTALADQGMVTSGRDATVGCLCGWGRGWRAGQERVSVSEAGGDAGGLERRVVVVAAGGKAGLCVRPGGPGVGCGGVRRLWFARGAGQAVGVGAGRAGHRRGRRRCHRPATPDRTIESARVDTAAHRGQRGRRLGRPASCSPSAMPCADGPARRARQPPGVKRPAGRRPVARSSGADQPRCCWAPFPE